MKGRWPWSGQQGRISALNHRIAKAPASAGVNHAIGSSCCLLDLYGLRLLVVQIGDGALRMRSCREYKALLTRQNVQPRCEVAGMIRSRFEFGRNPEIRAEEAAAELGDIS